MEGIGKTSQHVAPLGFWSQFGGKLEGRGGEGHPPWLGLLKWL